MRTLTIIIGLAVAVCACEPEPIPAGERESPPPPAVEPDEPERPVPQDPVDESSPDNPDAGPPEDAAPPVDAQAVDATAADAGPVDADVPARDAARGVCEQHVYGGRAQAAGPNGDEIGGLYMLNPQRDDDDTVCRVCPGPCPPDFTGTVPHGQGDQHCDQCGPGCPLPTCPPLGRRP